MVLASAAHNHVALGENSMIRAGRATYVNSAQSGLAVPMGEDRARDDRSSADEQETPPVDLKALHAKIGQLTLENEFLEGALSKAGMLSAKR
jgi:hypothetical protein